MENERRKKTEGVLQTVLAVIKSRDGLKTDACCLLNDLSAVAVAVKNAAQRLSGSASEISDAISRVVDDVCRCTGCETIVLDVENQAENERKHE